MRKQPILLAIREDGERISLTRSGMIDIEFQSQVLSFPKERYWEFVELVSKASLKLAERIANDKNAVTTKDHP